MLLSVGSQFELQVSVNQSSADFIKNWATLQSTFRRSTADQATVWLWLGTFKKRMINRFLIAYKRVTGLGRRPSLLIALQSSARRLHIRSCIGFDGGKACMDTALLCLSCYYGNLTAAFPQLLITRCYSLPGILHYFRTWHDCTWKSCSLKHKLHPKHRNVPKHVKSNNVKPGKAELDLCSPQQNKEAACDWFPPDFHIYHGSGSRFCEILHTEPVCTWSYNSHYTKHILQNCMIILSFCSHCVALYSCLCLFFSSL